MMMIGEKLDKILENQAYIIPLLEDIKRDVYGTPGQPGTGFKDRIMALETTRKALILFVTIGTFALGIATIVLQYTRNS